MTTDNTQEFDKTTEILDASSNDAPVKSSKLQRDLYRALPLKRKRFIKNYIETGNATKSAKLAGYSNKSAHITGHRLLKDVKVLTILNESVEKAQEVVNELLYSENEMTRLAAARETLDRTVGKSVTRTESTNVNITIEGMLGLDQSK